MLSVRGKQAPLSKTCTKMSCDTIGLHTHDTTQRDKVEWALKEFGTVKNAEFVFDLRITRFGSILKTLRDEGWVIETISDKAQGAFSYKLIAEPHEKQFSLL